MLSHGGLSADRGSLLLEELLLEKKLPPHQEVLLNALGLGFCGLGLAVRGLGYEVGILGLGVWVWGLGFWVWQFVFGVWSLGLRV